MESSQNVQNDLSGSGESNSVNVKFFLDQVFFNPSVNRQSARILRVQVSSKQ